MTYQIRVYTRDKWSWTFRGQLGPVSLADRKLLVLTDVDGSKSTFVMEHVIAVDCSEEKPEPEPVAPPIQLHDAGQDMKKPWWRW